MKAAELKISTIVAVDDIVYYVNEYQYVTNGTSTVVLTKLKNIETDEEIEKIFSVEDEVDTVEVEEKELMYSYSDEHFAYFVDSEKDIYKIDKSAISKVSDVCETDSPYRMQYCKGKLIKIIPPSYLDKLISE